jgi:hypothetical protein
MSDNKTWIKAYKGFDKDLKCKGRQYTEGVEDHVSDVAKLCKEGVHACERPLDVFRYYAPAGSVYHEVELAGVLDEHQEDSKICGTDIKVKGKLDIAGLIKAQIEYTKSHCTNEYNAENGKPASAGYYGASSAGYCGASSAGAHGASSAGDYGASSAGDYGASSAGYCGASSAGAHGASSAGYCGASSAGAHGASSAGDCGASSAGAHGASSAGDYGASTSKGKSSVGKNGIACSRSENARVKGDMGAVLVCAKENEYNYDIKTWAAGVVDGVNILPDVWYKAENGKLVPADD